MKTITFKKVKKFKISEKKVLTVGDVFGIINEHAREGEARNRKVDL